MAEFSGRQIEAVLPMASGKRGKVSLPPTLPDQVAAVRRVLEAVDTPVPAIELARQFSQGKKVERKVEDVLRTLALLGQAERLEGGYISTE